MTHCLGKILLLIAALLVNITASAQLSQLPVKTVGGKQYYYYQVKPQETVYSLCRRFGVSQDEMLRYNPSVADGLKADQELMFPVGKEADVAAATTTSTDYVVAKGETGYGLSRRFGMTLDEFYALNPSARDGLREGQTVKVAGRGPSMPRVADNTVNNEMAEASVPGTHVIAPKETLYQIAQKHGITVTQLLLANPGLDTENYKAGTVINIPSAQTYTVADAGNDEDVAVTDTAINVRPVQPRVAYSSGDTIVIAVALPFMASEPVRPKSAINATEFYKGLLVAVDSIGGDSRPVKILTFDTKGTLDGAKAVIADPRLREANVIIAPDKADQMAEFARFSADNGIYLLNLFVIRDETYRTNPYMMHANIPHTAMYETGAEYFLNTFPEMELVVLNRQDGLKDKAEFVELLKRKCDERGRKYMEVEFSGLLTSDMLTDLDMSKSYAFLPMSSKSDELSKVLPALVTLKNDHSGNVCLWGYPEWLVIRNDMLEKMHMFDTNVFSRFYSVESDPSEDRLDKLFVKWYGSPMADQVPRQGAYGFDVGMFLIKALNANNGDFNQSTPVYDGVQNAFDFIRVPGGGWINNELFILNYNPAGTVYKIGI